MTLANNSIIESLADLVPAEAGPVWEHRIRISLKAGERAFVKIMAQYLDSEWIRPTETREKMELHKRLPPKECQLPTPACSRSTTTSNHSSAIELLGFSSLLLWMKKNGRTTGRIAARTGSHPLQRSFLEEPDPPSIYLCSSMSLFGYELTAKFTFLVR